jgi:hypothetical protein
MKYFLIALGLAVALIISGCELDKSCAAPNVAGGVAEPVTGDKKAVLVELFTSEGCSSCPPADRLLMDLSTNQPYKGIEVIALGFHVDYWDHIGWRDRFSSPEHTKRQEEYSRRFRLDSTYTPQVVVDGEREVVGNSRQSVDDAISRSRGEKAEIRLEIKDDKLSVSVDRIPDHKGSTVFLAVAESGLRSAVSGGENSGRTLDHASVVRELKSLGKIESGRRSFTVQAVAPTKGEWKTDRLRYVVFVQDETTLKIHGVAAISAVITSSLAP